MITPTERQQDALRFIIGFKEMNGIGPSLKEISTGIGIAEGSMDPAHRLVACLEERGAVRRTRSRNRKIEVLQPIAIPRAPDGTPLHFVRIGEVA